MILAVPNVYSFIIIHLLQAVVHDVNRLMQAKKEHHNAAQNYKVRSLDEHMCSVLLLLYNCILFLRPLVCCICSLDPRC